MKNPLESKDPLRILRDLILNTLILRKTLRLTKKITCLTFTVYQSKDRRDSPSYTRILCPKWLVYSYESTP